jgi:hypothetical protein
MGISMTDVDFVNAYIAKLKATVDELMNKNIILETRLSLAEQKIQADTQLINTLQQKVTKKEKKTEETSF